MTSAQLCFILTLRSCLTIKIFDYEYDDIQGEDLLDQSADSEEEPMEQEVVMLIEVQPADPGHMLAYSDKGIFTEVDLINSRHVAAINAPTQEDP